MDKVLKGCMRLDKIVFAEMDAELLAQVPYAVLLKLPATVGEQDERDVVLIQIPERLGRAINGLCDMEQYAVDAVRD